MHLTDITMFYAPEGGGVSTYLNAKARWLAQRSRVRHTILSPSVTGAPAQARADAGAQTGASAQARADAEAQAGAPAQARADAWAQADAGCSESSWPEVGTSAVVRLASLGVPGLNGFRWPRSVSGACRALLALQPDLIEAGDAGPCAWAALRAKRRLGIPAVAFYHSDLTHLVGQRFGSSVMRATQAYLVRLYSQFDLVLAPSRVMVHHLAAMGVRGAMHQPLGIDVDIFTPRRRIETLRQVLQLAPDTRLLVSAGRFTREKKVGLLIEAVRRLGRPYHLVLVGGGLRLPADSQITHMGFRRDQRMLAKLLASCDLLVHPGDCETFGLIVLEAMACGLPVVAGRGGGVAELVDDTTGMLVTPDSSEALCDGIEAMYRRGLATAACAGRHKAHTLYDWNLIMPQLMHRYAGLLASGARAELEAEHAWVAE